MTVISGQRSPHRTTESLLSEWAKLIGQSFEPATFFLTRDFTTPNQQGSVVGNR
jgi:hypothetical protein